MARQRGFTLAEVMIVVAVIGLIAAIALPAYGRYVATAKVGRAMAQATGDQLRVEENLLNDLAACNRVSASVTCDTGNGALTSTHEGFSVVVTPTETGGGVTWTCDITVAPSGLSANDPCPAD